MNHTTFVLALFVLAMLADPVGAESARFATFNASMSRGAEGELATALQGGADPQIAKVAAIIRRVDPDVILINEFDFTAWEKRPCLRRGLPRWCLPVHLHRALQHWPSDRARPRRGRHRG